MIDKVIVLAAGEQKRWKDDKLLPVKQLLPVRNETIIGRIIRQCRERGYEPIVITHNDEIIQAVDCECVEPMARRWTCETFLTSPWGEDRTVVLLGDVIYSRELIDTILTDEKPARVFGHNRHEIFAVAFDVACTGWVCESLQRAITLAETEQMNRSGKIRKFYMALCGREDLNDDTLESNILYLVTDHTIDVDTSHDYKMLQLNLGRGLL